MTPTPPQAGGRKPQPDESFAPWPPTMTEAQRLFIRQLGRTLSTDAETTLRDILFHVGAKASGGGMGGGQPPTHSFEEWHDWYEPERFFGTQYQDGLAERKRYRREGWDAAVRDYDTGPARRQQTPQWVPVGERLPEALEPVLVFWNLPQTELGGEHGVDFVYKGRWQRSHPPSGVTHWMPLPAAPGGDAPPRPPQGRRLPTRVPCVPCPSCNRTSPGQGGAYFGPACSLGENCCTVELPPEPTPAPTLTAADVAMLCGCIDNLKWGGYEPHAQALTALRDRLLAAGAPTAATTAKEPSDGNH